MAGANKTKEQRPTGVTVVGALQILGGIIYMIAGAVYGAAVSHIGIVFIIIGAFALISGLALFSGKNWARILALVGGALDLLNIPVGTVIGIIILYYFTRPRVKEYFGK